VAAQDEPNPLHPGKFAQSVSLADVLDLGRRGVIVLVFGRVADGGAGRRHMIGFLPASTYIHGTVTVESTPTLLFNTAETECGALIQNSGAVTIYLGGSNVSASGATAGYQLGANGSVLVPTVANAQCSLYAASGSSTVTYLYPAS
jgi:hypothetical protein